MTEPVSIDPEMLDTLEEIVRWWRSQPGNIPKITERAIFMSAECATRSVRVPKEMISDAIAKAHKDHISNFNELIKFLLWQYLDRDPKFILSDTGSQ